jgi:TRAP-type C4-dicarboxylate transport system substrate-binding protein
MVEPLRVRLAGYAPTGSTHGRALDRIAAGLRAELGDGVTVEIDYNILDSGRPAQALLDDVEVGRTTLCYFSSSYLAQRVPGLGVIDLPYIFDSLDHAHAALDGPLGAALSERTQHATALVPLGYWDNGFRHISNRSRVIRSPADCRGVRIRLQPNWAQERFFRALGTEPVCNDLREGIALLTSGALDAQENPLANFVTYGIAALHPHVTLTGHVYGARGVYASARQLSAWSPRARDVLHDAVATAVTQQRAAAARVEAVLRAQLSRDGTHIVALSDREHAAFRAVAEPVLEHAWTYFDEVIVRLVGAG